MSRRVLSLLLGAAAAVLAIVLITAGGGGARCPNGPFVRPCGPHVKGFAVPPRTFSALPPVRGVATNEMFDSIIVSTVPANPWAVAGYVPGGSWPDYPDLVRAFPNAHHLSIAPHASGTADCLDVEPLDATPQQAAGWVKRMIALGHQLVCLYTSVSGMSTLKSLVTAAGIALSRVKWWCAWYRYHPGLIDGCDAVQWTDHALGRNLDESTVRFDFFGLPPDPYAKYPKPIRSFKVRRGVVHASEYKTVIAFDRGHCSRSKSRSCSFTRDHLDLLLGRITYLAYHRRDAHGGWHDLAKPRWGRFELGSRAAGIRARLG